MSKRKYLPRADQLADRHRLPACDQVEVADLKPLRHLSYYRTAAPGAEPGCGELVELLRAGGQPYAVVVTGYAVVFGTGLVEAAREAGLDALSVTECPGCAGLVDADLGLKAAGLHLAAVTRRARPDPFDARLLAARLYSAWSRHDRRRPPRPRDPDRREAWVALRASLVAEAFGRAQRTLMPDARLLQLPGPLLDAVRRRRLPESHVEAAAALAPAARLDLARRLAGGEAFADVRADFFPPAGPRTTRLGAARAVRACVRTIAAEADTLGGRSPLGSGDSAAARAALAHLQSWLDAPPPAPIDDRVAAALRELGPVAGDVIDAIRGGRRETAGVRS